MYNTYTLAIIAMFFWGVAPILGKIGLEGTPPLIALTIRSAIITLILVATVSLKGLWGLSAEVSLRSTAFIALEGICAALLGQLAYYYALKLGEVGKVSPIVAAFPIVAMLLGIAFLGEKITIMKIVASILIVTGVVLLKY